MGIIGTAIEFDEELPSLSEICTAIENISGLLVVHHESDTGVPGYTTAGIAFECARQSAIEIRFCAHNRNMNSSMKNEKPYIFITKYNGQDITLISVAELALESLGGTPTSPISDDDWLKFGTPISEAELHNRVRQATRKGLLLSIILAPLALLIWGPCISLLLLAAFLSWLVFLPFGLWDNFKARRRSR